MSNTDIHKLRFIDSHAHCHRIKEEPRQRFLKDIEGGNGSCISKVINVTITYDDLVDVINPKDGKGIFKDRLRGLDGMINDKLKYYAYGIHPKELHNAVYGGDYDMTEDEIADKEYKIVTALKDICSNPDNRAVGIGETGFEFYHDEPYQHKEMQRRWYGYHIELAYELGLPLIIHHRSSSDPIRGNANIEGIKVLRSFKEKLLPDPGVIHCFIGNMEEARIFCEELNFVLGIGAAFLNERNTELREVVKKIPLEWMVLETDSPYMKPKGLNTGYKQNTPLNIPYIAEEIVKLKNVSIEDVARVTTKNAFRVFTRLND